MQLDNQRGLTDEILKAVLGMAARLDQIETTVRETRALVGPFGMPLPGDRLLVHTLHGNLLIIEADDLIMTPQLVVYRQWEPEISALLVNSVTNNTVFVDVGANLGYFTVLAGSHIRQGGKGRVIAVEPNPECIDLVERNLAINWSMCDITLHKKGAAGAAGEGWLTAPINRTANSHLSYSTDTDPNVKKFKVELATLDSLVPADVEVDILKIDVEGYEKTVLDGAHDVIGRSKNIKIIMEWSVGQMQSAGFPPSAMLAKFRELGLVRRRLPKSRSLVNLTMEDSPLFSDEELLGTGYDNILLTPAS